jgi:hypothetical protein
MGHTIRPADLQALTPREQESLLDAFVACAAGPANGQLTTALGRVRAFEKQYEMRSDELLGKLKRNEIRETKEIASWLFWLGVVQARSGGR